MKSEGENLVKKLKGNNIFKNAERKNIFQLENFGRQNAVNWNHPNLILNWNQKYSDSIHIDLNHTNLNQLNPVNLKNIRLIHDSDNIFAIENKLTLPVHSLVHASSIFTYRSTSDPPSPPHDSLA